MSAYRMGHRLAGVALLGTVLVGCTGEQDELQQWMEQQKREVKPSVTPLSAPKKFDPQPYAQLNGVEPFSPQKLAVALKHQGANPEAASIALTWTLRRKGIILDALCQLREASGARLSTR